MESQNNINNHEQETVLDEKLSQNYLYYCCKYLLYVSGHYHLSIPIPDKFLTGKRDV